MVEIHKKIILHCFKDTFQYIITCVVLIVVSESVIIYNDGLSRNALIIFALIFFPFYIRVRKNMALFYVAMKDLKSNSVVTMQITVKSVQLDKKYSYMGPHVPVGIPQYTIIDQNENKFHISLKNGKATTYNDAEWLVKNFAGKKLQLSFKKTVK